ncbi:MAG: pantetheine-phosphate adenylyltransferase [Clostridia bacterium]|nr:pantetheine-phosphate adenylyltransferase [Clostridia bacterium]
MIAVYPGSFDPVTNGHLDIIERSASLFDKVYVAVLKNSSKMPLFSVEERCELIERVTHHLDNIVVTSFDGLLVDFVKKVDGKIIVKGLRALSDFEYEFQMALTNKKLDNDVETVFLSTSAQNQYLSSSIVKDIARYKGSLDGLVPAEIQNDIYKKLEK